MELTAFWRFLYGSYKLTDGIVTEEQLMQATDYGQRRRRSGCLKSQGIRFFKGKEGRIWTTEEELNHALRPGDKSEEIEFA